jgi:hypothetical protein
MVFHLESPVMQAGKAYQKSAIKSRSVKCARAIFSIEPIKITRDLTPATIGNHIPQIAAPVGPRPGFCLRRSAESCNKLRGLSKDLAISEIELFVHDCLCSWRELPDNK